MRPKFSQGSINGGSYEEAKGTLPKTQLNKLKFSAKNNTSPKFKMTKKNFPCEKLLHESFLTIRQKTEKEMPLLTKYRQIKNLANLSCSK